MTLKCVLSEEADRRESRGIHAERRWLLSQVPTARRRTIALAEPGFYEARETARTGTGSGMLLEDAIRQRRTNR